MTPQEEQHIEDAVNESMNSTISEITYILEKYGVVIRKADTNQVADFFIKLIKSKID
jgi:hypothetical protein